MLTLSSGILEELFDKAGTRTNCLTGDKSKSEECTTLGMGFIFLTMVGPKILIFSWMIATFQLWIFACFIMLVGHVVMSVNLYAEKKSRSNNARYDDKPNSFELIISSFFNSLYDIFGMSGNIVSCTVSLLFCSVVIFTVTACILPISSTGFSKIFNPMTNNVSIINDPQSEEEFCICKQMSVEEENGWKNMYLENTFVCMKYSTLNHKMIHNISRENVANIQLNVTKCYDPIFFEVPSYFSLLPWNDFPAMSTCLTFDAILGAQPGYEKLNSYLTKNYDPLRFDGNCYNVTVSERIRPCTDEIVHNVFVYFSLVITLMCFGVIIAIFSTMAASILITMERIVFESLTVTIRKCATIIVRKWRKILSVIFLMVFASLLGWACAKLNYLGITSI
jgi:hypothetical protein